MSFYWTTLDDLGVITDSLEECIAKFKTWKTCMEDR